MSFKVPSKVEDLAPIYVLASTEGLLLDRAIAGLRDRAVPEALRGFNLDALDVRSGADANAILAAASTLPMMAERRLVLVRSFDALAAAELGKLLGYLDKPNPSTVLVCLCAKVDKRIKFFATAKKLSYLHELGAPKRLDQWIRDEAAERGIALGRGVAERLSEVIGADLSRLGLALTQLDLYTGERAIEVDDVDMLVAETRERTVFELTDAIGAGDRQRAFEAVAALFDQRQSSIGVLMMLARHVRQLALCRDGLAEKLDRGELVQRVGAPPFVVAKLTEQARRYSVRGLAEALVLLGRADRALKGYDQSTKVLGRAMAERVVVERVVFALMDLAS